MGAARLPEDEDYRAGQADPPIETAIADGDNGDGSRTVLGPPACDITGACGNQAKEQRVKQQVGGSLAGGARIPAPHEAGDKPRDQRGERHDNDPYGERADTHHGEPARMV